MRRRSVMAYGPMSHLSRHAVLVCSTGALRARSVWHMVCQSTTLGSVAVLASGTGEWGGVLSWHMVPCPLTRFSCRIGFRHREWAAFVDALGPCHSLVQLARHISYRRACVGRSVMGHMVPRPLTGSVAAWSSHGACGAVTAWHMVHSPLTPVPCRIVQRGWASVRQSGPDVHFTRFSCRIAVSNGDGAASSAHGHGPMSYHSVSCRRISFRHGASAPFLSAGIWSMSTHSFSCSLASGIGNGAAFCQAYVPCPLISVQCRISLQASGHGGATFCVMAYGSHVHYLVQLRILHG
ncbi:hypothetical protein AVEN_34594-1 [Araneus ventricosus]|uniref:Uncharacterized protein n=1 Tax=Araneus ventricosus TaxID=182803 RepID=A0A4Y2B017_ARAVE|nr:hypothetical protein AVEN_34594-1 [Araneus ventricosus]